MIKRSFCGFLKGMGIGVMLGSMVGTAATCYMHSHRKGVKKNVGRALRTVGDLTDSIVGMF